MNSRVGKTLFAVAVLAIASLPVSSYANESQALDQCVQTFVKQVVPADRSVQVKQDDISASTIVLSATRSRVELEARSETNRKLLGRATCVMNRNGSLVAMYLYGSRPGMAGFSRPTVVIRNG
jgi:hypothetical protein